MNYLPKKGTKAKLKNPPLLIQYSGYLVKNSEILNHCYEILFGFGEVFTWKPNYALWHVTRWSIIELPNFFHFHFDSLNCTKSSPKEINEVFHPNKDVISRERFLFDGLIYHKNHGNSLPETCFPDALPYFFKQIRSTEIGTISLWIFFSSHIEAHRNPKRIDKKHFISEAWKERVREMAEEPLEKVAWYRRGLPFDVGLIFPQSSFRSSHGKGTSSRSPVAILLSKLGVRIITRNNRKACVSFSTP